MNYFEFFGIEAAFKIDAAVLKKAYLKKSKELHPDFNASDDVKEQLRIMEDAAYNNKAYKTLKNEDARFRYILELNEIFFVEGKETIPQAFLMEMMDINEAVMELQFEQDPEQIQKVRQEVNHIIDQLDDEINHLISEIDQKDVILVNKHTESKKSIKQYLLKKKYIKRLDENLQKILSS